MIIEKKFLIICMGGGIFLYICGVNAIEWASVFDYIRCFGGCF
jgi:hypothetical protein